MRMSLFRRRGFTLIEVMISILILALGLLGLGAIVPVIVHEQRRASERTLGVAAANAAQAYFESRFDLDPAAASSGWDRWFDTPVNNGTSAWSPVPPAGVNPNYSNAYLWEPLDETSISPVNLPEIQLTFTGNVAAGTLYLHRTNAPDEFSTIGIADRLWPSTSTQMVNISTQDAYRPTFVWDFVGRRLPSSAAATPWPSVEPQQIQLAIFVRRIDPGIRVPRAFHANGSAVSLRDVITGNVNPSDKRAAVAVDNNGNISNNGVGQYSTPLVVGAQRDVNFFDRIVLDNSTTAVQRAQAGQVGQRIVDNLGNVYTVLGPVDGTSGRTIRIDPPVSTSVLAQTNRLNSLRQIVFTPQVPAAVKIITINRPAQ